MSAAKPAKAPISRIAKGGQRDICALNNAKVERIENGAIRSVGWLEAAVNGDYPTGTSWQYATDV